MYIKLLLIIMIFFNIFYINCEDTKHITLRNYPSSLDTDDVKSMLKKYDFFCQEQEYDWNKDFCNTNGKGFDNAFVLQKDDQIVYDRKSGLMWQKGGSDNMSFKNAKEWVEQLDFAGFDDWRLPTLEEAMSLMEPEQNNHRYIDPIFDSKQYRIWTADQFKGAAAQWVVDFYDGYCGWSGVYYGLNYVRAVRSG